MKKIIAMMMVFCVMAAFAACSAADPGVPEQDAVSTAASESSVLNEDKEVSLPGEQESSPAQAETVSPTFDTTATIAETVLYEADGVKITATGLTYSPGEVDLELTIENNSTQDLSFSSSTLGYSANAINGIMVDDGYVNCDVAAGKIANESARFSTQQLMFYGIDRVAQVQMGFTISDADYNSTYTDPAMVQTSLGKGYEQPADSFQTAVQDSAVQSELGFTLPYFQAEGLFDQNGVQVVSTGLMENASGEQMFFLEAVNTGEQPVYFSTSDFSFNGVAVLSYNWSSDLILPNARRVMTVDPGNVFEEEFWPAYGIKALALVDMNVTLKDSGGNELIADTPLRVQVSQEASTGDTKGVEVYNANGIRVLSKGLAVDDLDRTCALLLVENTSGQAVDAGVAYDSLSIGGVMNDFSCSDQTVPDGGMGALVVSLDDWEDTGSTAVENVGVLEFQLEFRSEATYDTIDSPKVTLNFSDGIAN